MIDTQGKQLGMKFTDPMEYTGARIRQIEQWKKMARYDPFLSEIRGYYSKNLSILNISSYRD